MPSFEQHLLVSFKHRAANVLRYSVYSSRRPLLGIASTGGVWCSYCTSASRWVGKCAFAYKQSVIRVSINVVENRGREILLLRRSPHARLGAGRWGFPAGRLERRETPSQCALRELTEGIGAEHRIESISKLGPIGDTFYGGIFEIYLFTIDGWRDASC
ncbi:MAG: NUDIX hydrolase [Gammaproteobacteria bacterium]